MAYGFNDDKSKATINNCIFISGTITSSDTNPVVYISTNDLLNNYGISNITDYMVVGEMIKRNSSYSWNANSEYINVDYPSDTSLRITLYPNVSGTKTISYKVALMKVS